MVSPRVPPTLVGGGWGFVGVPRPQCSARQRSRAAASRPCWQTRPWAGPALVGVVSLPAASRRRRRRRCGLSRLPCPAVEPQPLDCGEVQTPLVKVSLESDLPEALADFLLEIGACSAAISAAPGPSPAAGDDVPILQAAPGDESPLWKHALVTAMFDIDADLASVAELVQAAFDLPTTPDLRAEAVQARDWVADVQKLWEPLPLGESFEIRLPWHGNEDAGGRKVLRLEGGAAFGLGDHPTTQGAASFLERTVSEGSCRVLDYGTGSGILAFTAAMLGASMAIGVDVDKTSLASARRSLALNAEQQGLLEGRTHFGMAPADTGCAESFVQALVEEWGHFDVVVANIIRRPLVDLAPALAAAARPGALLGLTGLREDLGDAAAIREAYGPAFEGFRELPLESGWLLIEARRRRRRSSEVG